MQKTPNKQTNTPKTQHKQTNKPTKPATLADLAQAGKSGVKPGSWMLGKGQVNSLIYITYTEKKMFLYS